MVLILQRMDIYFMMHISVFITVPTEVQYLAMTYYVLTALATQFTLSIDYTHETEFSLIYCALY